MQCERSMAAFFTEVYASDPEGLAACLAKHLGDSFAGGEREKAVAILDAFEQSSPRDDPRFLASFLLQLAEPRADCPLPRHPALTAVRALGQLKYDVAERLDDNRRLAFLQQEAPLIEDRLQRTHGEILTLLHVRAEATRPPSAAPSTAESTSSLSGVPQAALGRSLLSLTGDYFVLHLDSAFAILDASPSTAKILGFQRGELVGSGLAELFDPKFEESGRQELFFQQLKQQGNWEGEAILRCWDGRELYAHLSLTRLGDAALADGFLAIGRDLSEQRALQEKLVSYTTDLQQIVAERNSDLEESEERYRQLIEGINEGYFIAQGERLIFVNKAFATITGYTRTELNDMRFLDLIIVRSEEGARTWWWKVAAGGLSRPVELLIRRKDGKKAVVECKAQRLELRGVPHVIGVLHDITEKKKMERRLQRYVQDLEKIAAERTKELEMSLQELKSTQFQLVQSEKLAGIGILAAGVAHEINNPLQALLLKSQYILRHIDRQLEVKRSVRDIIQYVNRMAEIVRGLSKYARTVKNEKDWTAVDLVEIIKESLELSYHTRNFGDVIVKRDFGTIPPVIGNKGQYQQIFINLIVNAIDAMEGKGKLTLRLKPYDPHTVLAEVEDTGCGIPEENLDKIFTPLFTTKPSGKGTGMGLHVAYRIVTQYGGDIKVRSATSKGTVFEIFFPVAEGKPAQDAVELPTL
ncbi:MAG: PAS domain S-box protein [Myxococcales bacterium]|nr:MAG: PAS domain S-box protein [Myxococcales bacterium]